MTRRRPLSAAEQEARIRAAHAVSLQRANPGWSLSRAAREAHTTRRTVLRRMPKAYRRDGARWQVTRGDRERFPMRVVSVERGVVTRVVTGSRKRSLVGRHDAAVGHYLATGDRAPLDALAGQKVAGLSLLTDPAALRELWRRGELSFLEIYALAG